MSRIKIFQGAVRITEKRGVCDETVSIRMEPLRGRMPIPKPGQFGSLTVKSPCWETPLQRPFSFSDANEMTVRIAYSMKGSSGEEERVPGPVSSYIVNELSEGDIALLRAPMGNSFLDFVSYADMIYLVGGGCGVAPLYYFARTLKHLHKRFIVLNGAKTRGGVIRADDLEVVTAIENGDGEKKGTVVDMMSEYDFEKDSLFCICGPRGMLRPAAEIAKKYTSPEKILINAEEMMKCGGRGVCDSCGIGGLHACTDGPTFRYSDIMDSEFFAYRTSKSGKRISVLF